MPYGPFLYPGATTYPGSTTYPGQGDLNETRPELQVLVTFDDASVGNPGWSDVTGRTFNFRTTRGRDDELAEISAGTASALFDNKNRFFLPGTASPLYPGSSTYPGTGPFGGTFPGGGGAGPMNRLWIREFFNAKTRTLFYGYADSYDFAWDFLAERATLNASDEFKILALARLPRNTPDVESYADVVQFDNPTGYWRFNDEAGVTEFQGTGGTLRYSGTPPTRSTASPVTGDLGRNLGQLSVIPATDALLTTDVVDAHAVGDAAGLTGFTVELWFRIQNGPPTSIDYLAAGPDRTGSLPQYTLSVKSTGQLEWIVDGTSGTTLTAGSVYMPSGFSPWHHVVAVKDGTTLRLYLDGTQVGSQAYTGSVGAVVGNAFRLNGTGGNSKSINYDEVAWYPYALSSGRVAEHYASASRGFPAQSVTDRLNAVLDVSGSSVNRNFRTSQQTITPTFQHGQDALSEIRQAVQAEGKDSMVFAGPTDPTPFFTGQNGLVFLDANHRSFSPWNTVQAVFADPASSPNVPANMAVIPYLEMQRDYSETFLFNKITVNDLLGNTATIDDGPSNTRYGEHAKEFTIGTSGGGVANIAQALLDKYKLPMERVTSITVDTTNPDSADALFDLELGDQVRVIYSPSGIDQRAFIQKIEWSGANDGRPWLCRLALSPL